MATIIDLRSDTVTRPSAEMRRIMAAAPVGDDQYGDDPSANALQDKTADLLGKEAALWFPTGTMANQAALRLLTRPGDDVIVGQEAHSVWHEAGGSAANAGVQFTPIGTGGLFNAAAVLAAIKPSAHGIFPPTTLVQIENTHNRMGGRIFPQPDVVDICKLASTHGLSSYLDGARIWNASVKTGIPVSALCQPFDLVMVSFSKGLGAPAGSILAGTRDMIDALVRQRRMLGGAMRQIGILAAAASFALDHNIERLEEDHANAQALASRLATSERIRIDPAKLDTNIVVFELTDKAPDASALVDASRSAGVLINAISDRKIRALTHLDVNHAQCLKAAEVILKTVG